MTLPVFIVDSAALSEDVVEVSGSEGRHATVVRRIRAGERIVLTDGAGRGAECRVVATTPRGLVAEVEARRVEPAGSPRLTVVQALVKGDAADLAVDLLTQIGVDAIVPWAASRSVAPWRGDRGDKALRRWQTTVREAGKQARRLRFPDVLPLHTTMQVATLLGGATVAYLLHQAGDVPLASVAVPQAGDVVLVVGPEGGVSDEELDSFRSVGAEPVRLGPSVLRSSLAGTVGAGIVLSRTSRWS